MFNANVGVPETEYRNWSAEMYDLDAIGLIPIIGAPADGVNGVIYLN